MFFAVVSRGWVPVCTALLLGRQAEGVPAHRVQDVEALHALVAGEDVRGDVAFRVADVQTPRRRGTGNMSMMKYFGFSLPGSPGLAARNVL